MNQKVQDIVFQDNDVPTDDALHCMAWHGSDPYVCAALGKLHNVSLRAGGPAELLNDCCNCHLGQSAIHLLPRHHPRCLSQPPVVSSAIVGTLSGCHDGSLY
jgi:hypothetical protein